MVKLFGGDPPKLGVLTVNNMHNLETLRHLHAAEEHRSSDQRAGVRATAEEIMCLPLSSKRGATPWHFHPF